MKTSRLMLGSREITADLYPVASPESIASPSLVFYPHLIRDNIERMLEITDRRPERLCPHVKTHKTREIVRLELESGIKKHKCATIREALTLAEAGARDITVAYPLFGPWVPALFRLRRRFPDCKFTAIVDTPSSVHVLAEHASRDERPLPVLVDVDVGMHRTGVAPDQAPALARLVHNTQGLILEGFHCYDGHHKDPSPEVRRSRAREVVNLAFRIADELARDGIEVRRFVMGGTPTFPFYAEEPDPRVECSPGTCVLHDIGYGIRFPDLGFVPAAVVLSRVISHPGRDLICIDCGYKAVAADHPPDQRFKIAEHVDARLVGHSEEHAVLQLTDNRPPLGSLLRVLPSHICPTVAHYDEALILHPDGTQAGIWPIAARSRSMGE